MGIVDWLVIVAYACVIVGYRTYSAVDTTTGYEWLQVAQITPVNEHSKGRGVSAPASGLHGEYRHCDFYHLFERSRPAVDDEYCVDHPMFFTGRSPGGNCGQRRGPRDPFGAKSMKQLYIDGAWTDGAGGRTWTVTNPATGERIADVAVAAAEDVASRCAGSSPRV